MKSKMIGAVLCILASSSALAGEYFESYFALGRIEHLQLLNVPTFTGTPLAAGTVSIALAVKADMEVQR